MKNILIFILITCFSFPNNMMGQVSGNNSQFRIGEMKTVSGLNSVGINPDKSYTTEQLINDIFVGGNCFEVSNIVYHGNSNAIGYFSNGNSSIGINEGIILSTGDIDYISGPNSSSSSAFCYATSGDNHPDLPSLFPGIPAFDLAEIEFDFTPTVNTIQFQYVFGSEEYCEWIGTNYNDHFGFFISGPGISGPFSNNGKNIAIVPGTQDYVSINSINDNANNAYFISNSNDCNTPSTVSNEIEYDGFTNVLTATANVIPCETYHIRLAIADFGDCGYDSGVFLKANSFNLGGNANISTVTPLSNQSVTYEGCNNGLFTFTRASNTNLNQPLEICFSIGGTATQGLDYEVIDNCITIPAGSYSYELPIIANYDFLNEGPETIVLQLDLPCSCSDPSTILIIEDNIPMDIEVEDLILCGNEQGIISPIVTGGVNPLFYEWSTGENSLEIIVPPLTQTYNITVTDGCGNIEEKVINVLSVSEPEIHLDTLNNVSCFNESDGGIYTHQESGTPPFNFEWNTGNSDSYLEGLNGGTYILTLTDSYGCLDVDSFFIYEPLQLEATVSVDSVICFGESNGIIWIDTVFNGTPPYNYYLDGISYTDPIGFFNLKAGNYFLDIIDANDCMIGFNLEVKEPPLLTIEIEGDSINELGYPLELIAIPTNPYPTDLYLEWPNFNCPDCLELSDLPLFETNYSVLVTDINGCSASDQFKVLVKKSRHVFIPNAFSPNDDGQNDIFTIHGGKDVEMVLDFKIFNRWGELLFEAQNFTPNDDSFGWNGKTNDKTYQPGVYVFFAKIKFIDDYVVLYQGDISLVK